MCDHIHMGLGHSSCHVLGGGMAAHVMCWVGIASHRQQCSGQCALHLGDILPPTLLLLCIKQHAHTHTPFLPSAPELRIVPSRVGSLTVYPVEVAHPHAHSTHPFPAGSPEVIAAEDKQLVRDNLLEALVR